MGFIKRERKRKFEFKHFGVSHSVDRPEPGYEPLSVHNPSTGVDVIKYVQKFDAVEGQVVDAEWYDRKDDGGHRYVGYLLTMDVEGELINLDFPYGKPAYRVLTRCGKNVDWTRPVQFSAWQSSTPQGKPTIAVCFSQGETPEGKKNIIKWAYTREHPNGCPEPTESVKGLNWDNVERWLKAQFDSGVLPRIKAAGQAYARPTSANDAAMSAQAPLTDEAYPYEEDDSVPF